MKELEDYPWFPSLLRKYQTEFIGFVVARFKVYDSFIEQIRASDLPLLPMTDLCSGSSEPAISIFKKSNCFSRLALTDKYPGSLGLSDDKIIYETKAYDVLNMEFHSGTCYTMFNAFHHFTDNEKLKIIQRLQNSRSPAFIVEILEPSIICLLKVIFTTTIGTLILMPFIRPFSLLRIIFTYLIPINIITITFDGIVSVFKSRSVKQYQKLFTEYNNSIKIYQLKSLLNKLTVIQIEGIK